MTTLFDAMLRIARELDEDIWESAATSTTNTTSLADTTNLEASDFWNGGTIFFKTGGATGLNASKTRVITDFTETTGVFAFAALGEAVAATNQYLALTKAWPRSRLVQAINTALGKQNIISEDETTDIVADTIKYSLPTGVSDVLRVEFGNDTDGWEISHTWREEGGEIRFYANEPTTTTDHIKLHYRAKHAAVGADADTINAGINQDLLVLDALAELHLQRAMRSDENPRENNRFTYYNTLAEKQRNRKPQRSPDPRHSGL